MQLSIVSTLYRSSPYIEEFISRALGSAKELFGDLQMVIVDDGSPDDALQKVLKMKATCPCLTIIQLSRNFGHHEAILTGLQHATGDLVFLMDCDLEEPPEDLSRFLMTMKENPGTDVVYGVQKQRSRGLSDRFLGGVYYKVFNLLSTVEIPKNLTTTRLMTRDYVRALLEHEEVDVVLSGLWASTGFKQVSIEVNKVFKGTSSYNLRRHLSLVVRSITSFSAKPLVYIFYIGFTIFCVALLTILWSLYRKVFHNVGVGGWTSMMVSVWFIGGLIMLSIGVVGIYIERIFRQVKQRPRTIVRKIY